MKIDYKKLIICIAIPLIVGGISSLLTQGSMEQFEQLNQPPLSPPGIAFPIVWTILYTLMGISSYLILTSGENKENIHNALFVYGLQLFVNFLWPIFFFLAGWYLFAFFWLIFLWILVLRMMLLFYPINKKAAYLQIPYLLWLTFAAYLNLGVYLLN